MSEENQKEMVKIRDLVEVPEIRTVIQLQDLEDPDLCRMIIETFVLTGEVQDNLRAIFTSLSGRQGRGIFLKGHFGSGKSHFLSILSLLLSRSESWDMVLSQAPSLQEFKERLAGHRYIVVDISLVQHRSSEFLEDVFLRSILHAILNQAGVEVGGADTRKETFDEIKEKLEAHGFSGMVLLVDELSEFLKSKPDARAYNEDIRFLQYLGEEAPSFPLWVVASLQEWIEETGEIHQDTFNKIKDRYRVRLNLGRAHIEELISERLIRKKQGAESKINEIFDQVKSYFPTFPVTQERFLRLYPVHPATCSLLDRLKPLFSEHRGVVDFIHFRLKGDPERHIPSSLDRPAHQLLTPETLFDHFLDRILERSETQVYVERVYGYYQAEIPELFQDDDQRRVASSAVKLLILFAVSPVKFKYTVRHLAEMVLFGITSLDAQINYQFIYDILDRLEKEGSYVRVEERQDPLDNHYFVDLKADIAGIMRQKVRHLASEIFPEDRRLFTHLATMVDSPYLPLAGWLEQGKEEVAVLWQHTRRMGVLYLRQLNELALEELESLGNHWQGSEDDFFIFVGTTHDRESQYRHVKEKLLPLARTRYPGIFLFWIPAAMETDQARLKEILASILMLERIKKERSGRAEEEESFLRTFLEREKKTLTDLSVQSYFEGILLWDENQVELAHFGRLTREKFLGEFVQPLLERRFPRHNRIRPYMDAFITGILKEMLRDFLSSGVLVVDEKAKSGIRNVLEGLLKPMGLIKKKGNRYELQIHPRQNELAREFFEKMGERQTVPLEEMYWHFRKGEYGLLMPQFEILALSLLFSGHLVAYRAMNRKSAEDLARSGLKGITALGRGEILDEELRKAMEDQPLIPEKYLKIPLTLASQEELWSEIRSQKPAVLEDLESLKSRIHWAASFQAFKYFPWDELLRDIDALIAQWEEVKVSFPSREGLERFIRAGQREPLLSEKLARVQAARGFLDRAERALFIYQYITDPKLQIPEGEAYIELREALSGLLAFYRERPKVLSQDLLEKLFERFHRFQEAYVRVYVEAHHRVRGAGRFEPYEKLKRSRRYRLLRKLDQLEMVSVEHNLRSIEQALSSVLLKRCERPVQDQLQAQPACSCGFRLGEDTALPAIKDLEQNIDLGIRETFEALGSALMQDKIIPYLKGLDLVGKKKEADEIRGFLSLSVEEEIFFDMLDKAPGSRVIEGINEAFRGKVVVVQRDLDQLYESLVHRKYTLAQAREILSRWLEGEDLSDDTFLHFLGKGQIKRSGTIEETFLSFMEARPGPHMELYREFGRDMTAKAVISALWAQQYQIPAHKLVEILTFLDRGGKKENQEWISYLNELGRTLRIEAPRLFEAMVSRIEEDPSFVQALWALISSATPLEVFKKESIFPLILKEAFERLLASHGKEAKGAALEEPGAEPGEATSVLQKQKSDMMEALKAYHGFRENAASLKAPDEALGPEAYSRWESLYRQKMAHLPSSSATLREILYRIGIVPPPFLIQEEKEAMERLLDLNELFASFYGESISIWEKGEGKRPIMIQDIPYLLKKKRDVPDHKKVRYVLMDGMRWDLWEAIKGGLFEKVPQHFRIVKEGPLWASPPTNTRSQLDRFEEAFRAACAGQDLSECFIKVRGIDEKIHTEKGPLTHLFANVLRYLETDLIFTLQRLPPRTLIILFADHGFVENPAFDPAQKYESSRYIHGQLSPFEVIVPWAWVMRI